MPIKPIITSNGPLEFEASSAFAYRFARYLIIPLVTKTDTFTSGETFHLLTLIKQIANEYLTEEEQETEYVKKNGGLESVNDAIRWYVPFIGRDIKAIERVKPGWYRMPTGVSTVDNDEENIEEEVIEEIAQESGVNPSGWIYAFTFPELISDKPFSIKIGMTIRNVEERVADQCKGSGFFSHPMILKFWEVRNVSLTERTIQNLLKLGGKWKSDAPGSEWFVTTIEDVDRIVSMVRNETK